MEKSGYTTAQIANITGFTLRQLDYWAREKIIVPELQEAIGSGSRRLYSSDDLKLLYFVRQLKKHHWSTQKIHQAISTLKEVIRDPDSLKSVILLHGRGTIFALSKTEEGERILIDALTNAGQLALNNVLETLIDEAQKSDYPRNPSLPGGNVQEVQVGGNI